MGAWGHGLFENDTAADFVWKVEESSDPKQTIKEAFDAVFEEDYLDSDPASEAIAAAAFIDRQLNGTKFADADGVGPLEVDNFPENHPGIDLSDLKSNAVKALRRVLGEDSELNELWSDAEDDYPLWKKDVESLIDRLT